MHSVVVLGYALKHKKGTTYMYKLKNCIHSFLLFEKLPVLNLKSFLYNTVVIEFKTNI